jgi:hypothetical protein
MIRWPVSSQDRIVTKNHTFQTFFVFSSFLNLSDLRKEGPMSKVGSRYAVFLVLGSSACAPYVQLLLAHTPYV